MGRGEFCCAQVSERIPKNPGPPSQLPVPRAAPGVAVPALGSVRSPSIPVPADPRFQQDSSEIPLIPHSDFHPPNQTGAQGAVPTLPSLPLDRFGEPGCQGLASSDKGGPVASQGGTGDALPVPAGSGNKDKAAGWTAK